MEKKTTRSVTGAIHAKDLAKVAAQIGSAQNLAKQMSAIAAPGNALKDVSKNLSQYNEITKASVMAAEIAHNGLGDAAKKLAASLSKIDLNLPDISRTIQASLPRRLSDPYLHRGRECTTPIEETASQSDRTLPKIEPAESEIASPEDLGLLIRRIRERRKLSQQSFADLANVGRRFVSELENGKPTLELGKVLKVAHAAGVSVFARGR